MIIKYKYGFEYKGFNFGWKNKKLFRLPSCKNFGNGDIRNFNLKEVKLIDIGNKKGYRVVRDKKTIEQLMEITEIINYKHTINGAGSEDCPF